MRDIKQSRVEWIKHSAAVRVPESDQDLGEGDSAGGGAGGCLLRRRTSKQGKFASGSLDSTLIWAKKSLQRFVLFFFRVLDQNQLNLRSWRPGSGVACGALGSLSSGTRDPKPWFILGERI